MSERLPLSSKHSEKNMTSTVSNGNTNAAGQVPGSGDGDESANLPGSSFSLVRYNNPVLIDKHPETPSITPPTSSKYRSNYWWKIDVSKNDTSSL